MLPAGLIGSVTICVICPVNDLRDLLRSQNILTHEMLAYLRRLLSG
ncbi:MAG: hypothetical protein AB7W28_09885 [Armatimonadota bacterium]